MMRRRMILALALMTLAAGCGKADRTEGAAREVVVYTALDQIYSEPILKEFERRTGIAVRPVYDSEAAKTTGLVARLVAERERPVCDVFWNNEIVRTLELADKALLDAYHSPAAETIPPAFKDAEGHWTGFAAGARVIAWNTDQVTTGEAPRSIGELTDPRWRGKLAIAYPLFGTTATHGAVLFAQWGDARAREFFEALAANGVKIVDGNATACRMVAEGEIALALTDTDDASLMASQGYPVAYAPLDHDGQGALLIPNTVALIAGAPHAEEGRALIDWLLSPEVEAMLAATESLQVPLHPGVEVPPAVEALGRAKFWEVDWPAAVGHMEESSRYFQSRFGR